MCFYLYLFAYSVVYVLLSLSSRKYVRSTHMCVCTVSVAPLLSSLVLCHGWKVTTAIHTDRSLLDMTSSEERSHYFAVSGERRGEERHLNLTLEEEEEEEEELLSFRTPPLFLYH